MLYFRLLCVPVRMWRCSVVWSCFCLTNVTMLYCVIQSVSVSKSQCPVFCHSDYLYQCGIALFVMLWKPVPIRCALLCDTLSAFTNVQCSNFFSVNTCNNVTMLLCVILCVPLLIWKCSVAWYCQYLNQCGSSMLCDNFSACSNVALFCFVIMWEPVPMWQCSVLW